MSTTTEPAVTSPARKRSGMAKYLVLLWAGMSLCVATVACGVEFTALELQEIPTSMAFSESGEFLFVAHQQANTISIYNVWTGANVAYVPCQTPKSMVFRGRKLFVANFGKGTISVFSADKKWELMDELLVGEPNVYHLSAPCEARFDGTILVTAGKYTDHRVIAVDTKSDKSRQVRKEVYISLASFSSDGNTILQQSEISHSPSATVQSFDAKTYLAGERAQYLAGEHESTPILYQVPHSSFWFGTRSLYAGSPPKPFGTELGEMLIPDMTRMCFYAVTTNAICAHKLDPRTQEIGRIPLTKPLPVSKWANKIWTDYTFHFPAGITHGNTTTLFVLIPEKKVLMTCKFPVIALDKAGTAKNSQSPGAAKTTPSGELPPRVVVGKTVTVRLTDNAASGQYKVISGPEGASISSAGVLTWKPAEADIGPQQMKIRCEVGGTVSFLRLNTEVVSASLVEKVSGDLSKLDELGTHYITSKTYDLQNSLDGKSMLLLGDRTLNVLDEEGLVVTKTLSLDADCKLLRERSNYYIGTARNQMFIIDKKSGKTLRTIDLPGVALDLALYPEEPFSFVACQCKVEEGVSPLVGRRVMLVDENKGRVIPLSRTLGQWLAMDASGKYLFTALHDLIDQGDQYDAWGRVRMSYVNIDLVMCYEIGAEGLSNVAANLSPGANGRALRISGDGKHVSFVSGGGYREEGGRGGYTVPAFPSGNISMAETLYETGAYPIDVAYHPSLGLVAACTEKEIQLFERSSGRVIPNKVDFKKRQLSSVNRLFFAPGGHHLLVESKDESGKSAIRALPLVLTAEEQKVLTQPPQRPKVNAVSRKAFQNLAIGKTRKVKSSELDSCSSSPGSSSKTPKEIGNAYMDSVVVIKSGSSSGTGFFIGRKGYILTCDHVIPMLGTIKVSYRKTANGKSVTVEATATVVSSDEKNDLTLLKIETTDSLPTVRFAPATPAETGDSVVIIGHPGAGGGILDYTMTQGIVSSPARMINELPYIQTSAAINPGSSGAPMFDAKGNVIGVVTLKASIEGAGFAVPMSRIQAFIKSVTE